MFRRFVLTVLAAATLTAAAAPAAAAPARVVFIHHSSGRNLLAEGSVRTHLASAAAEAGLEAPRLWDHDYNVAPWGLSNPSGAKLGYSWNIPDDNTDPVGLHKLWTTANAARDSILSRFDVIAFKSCYTPACEIRTDAQLQQYKDWYLEIRDVLDQHPDKVFLIMSPPALFIDRNDVAWADRSRAFARWLGSDEFLKGHPNLRYFDLFDLIANPDDGSDTRNMQRPEYRRNPDILDSHPNELANQTVGPAFARALLDAAALPNSSAGWGGIKAEYR